MTLLRSHWFEWVLEARFVRAGEERFDMSSETTDMMLCQQAVVRTVWPIDSSMQIDSAEGQ